MISDAALRPTKVGARHRCPRCASRGIARIMYGYPIFDDELQAQLDSREIVLGGCVLIGDDPEFRCHKCGLEFSDRPAVAS